MVMTTPQLAFVSAGKEGTCCSLRHGGGLHRGHLDDEREGYGAISTGVSAVSGLGNHGVVEERAVARR